MPETLEENVSRDHEKHEQIEVTVNGRPVSLPKEDLTGLEIKQAAISQGVPITLSFILQLELPNGNGRVVGDNDPIKVHPHERFTAIENDDNS